MMKIVLAAVLGGIVVFLWGFASHAVLPLGTAGIQDLPNEDAVTGTLRVAVREPGLYFFPGMPMSPGMTKSQKAAAEKLWSERLRRGPSGLLVYTPGGKEPMSLAQLGAELLSDVLGAMVAAILLSMAGPIGSFGMRVLFVTLLGLFASLAIDLSYWIWYGFPALYTAAAAVDQTLSWFFAGLVLARVVKKGA